MTGTKDVKKLVTPVFRLSFPHVFEPQTMRRDDGSMGDPKFGLSAIFEPDKFSPKDKERWKAMMALADATSLAAFKKKIADLPANFKRPIRDGAEKEDLGYPAGSKFGNFTSKFKPGVVDRDGAPIIDREEIYPGCYCRATVTCYHYTNVGKGVAFGLNNLQKIADGERLDSRTDAAEDFGGEELDYEDSFGGSDKAGDDEFLD